MNTPKIVDNDAGEISAMLDGKEIRGWSYMGDAVRIQKMRQAREFCNGWIACMNKLCAHQVALSEAAE